MEKRDMGSVEKGDSAESTENPSTAGFFKKKVGTAGNPKNVERGNLLRNMIRIPGGTFLMGSDDFYPEEQPAQRVGVDAFWIDESPVTNQEFSRFVEETGYTTVAERAPNPVDYPGIDPDLLVPGSLVFQKPSRRVGPHQLHAWWRYIPDTCWKYPEGPESDISSRPHHPVVHIACEDAEAYAQWAGKELPTEAEWEYASRGGVEGAVYVWGDEFAPDGRIRANIWQGEFPWQNLKAKGEQGTSRVGTFPANGYGLYDMAGNVWEWTGDFYRPQHSGNGEKSCCIPHNPRVTSAEKSTKKRPGEPIPRKVLKGGSHLCAPNYCLRYRPAARQPQAVDTSASHLGFRCIVRNGSHND